MLRTSRLRMHASRGLLHYAGQLGWFYALTLIPLGQVVSLEFTMPIWTAILAASFLGERMTIWKILAIVLGLIGVFVIVRPATGEINPGQLIALAAAVSFGTSVAMMKSLTRTEASVAIVFWMMVVQAVAGALPTLYVWVWPSPYVWACAIAVAISGTFSHFCMARAMLYADATIVMPMDFLRVPLDRHRGLAVLCRADGRVHRPGRSSHPGRQSLEPEVSGAEGRGSRSLRHLFPRGLPQGFVDSILPAGATLLEVFEHVLVDPQRHRFLHARNRIRLRWAFGLLLRYFLERRLRFATSIVQGSRSPRLVRHQSSGRLNSFKQDS